MNDMAVIPAIPVIAGSHPYRMEATGYMRLILAGGFGDAHVELVEGELIEMAPAGTDHGAKNADVLIELASIYRPLGFVLMADAIVRLTHDTVRAPDISVIDRDIGERTYLEPADILLAVEIANSTLTEDLGRKRIDYASAGIRHYWVVDVEGHRTHCYADPEGADYAAITVVPFGAALAVPDSDATVVVK
jgi:Uma2 family endonuclease